MELLAYRKMRTGVQTNAAPATPDTIRPMVRRLQDSLVATGYFSDVEVDGTDNVDAMVIGMCTFPPEIEAGRLAHWLEQLWDHLRYRCWEAHAVLVDDDQVEFLGATRVSVNGPYVTLHLIAQRAFVPAQRDGAAEDQ
jgi:hypothetical protein